MDTGISGYRKLISFMVTAAIMYVLQMHGLTADILPQYGVAMSELGSELTNFIIQYGTAAVVLASQPNERGESLFRDYWHWLIGGTAILAVAIATLALVL